MKLILLFLTISVGFISNEEEYKFITKYIDVPLDHFSFTVNNTFKLRYLINDSYFNQDDPIFFYTGNEGDISMFAQNTGFIFDLARKLGALIVFAEHRFYGETLPFGNASYSSPQNLGYLSAQQALADYVYLINDLQKQYGKNVDIIKLPVIAFGGSYGGMLAAWIRIKYPYAVTGAIASSAPIWQFQGLTPCENFYKIVTDVIRSLGSESCVNTLTKSWGILRNLTKTDKGKTDVSNTFKLCQPLKNQNNTDALLSWLSDIYVNIVMINYPYPTSFLVPLPGNPVKEFCQAIDSSDSTGDEDLLTAVAKGLEIYTNFTSSVKCNDILADPAPNLGYLGWYFQSCTDMIMPICSTKDDLFEDYQWDFSEFSNSCFKKFSVRPRNEEVPILEFGGKDIETATNIVFSNGLLDPWSSGGVLKNISSQVVSILIPDGAHHVDLRSSNPLDNEDVKVARQFHEIQIKKWLDKYYFHNLPLDVYSEKFKGRF
ncbi:hypothetical protein ABEB36_011459 [Hypothenemus hampei]|uniref:Lysosomal Pro-X carboxypeptidase n=1 Tax=Hypothenemus hampei TaxID=57062 RepID=A0ABD1EFH9_HYPHA